MTKTPFAPIKMDLIYVHARKGIREMVFFARVRKEPFNFNFFHFNVRKYSSCEKFI